jgi:phosphate transport system substrate-binding protein
MRAANGAGSIASRTGNDGVRDYVSATSYSIGYVEMAFSYATNVRQVAIKNNPVGTAAATYLLPTQSGANAAIAAQNAKATASGASATEIAENDPVNPSGSYLQPVNQVGATAYPIVGYSWVLLYKNFDGTIAGAPTKGQVEGLIYFFNWSITKGAVYTAGTTKCYSPLPAAVKTRVIAELKKVKFNNVTVWR